jgi:hypothetical protein
MLGPTTNKPFENNEKARLVVPSSEKAAGHSLKPHLSRLSQLHEKKLAYLNYFERNKAMSNRRDHNLREREHLRRVITAILEKHPILYDLVSPNDLGINAYLTNWVNRNRGKEAARLKNQKHGNFSNGAGSSRAPSNAKFAKELPIYRQYGSSSVPTLRKRGSTVSTSLGKRKEPDDDKHMTLYHVITHEHDELKPGDVVRLPGATWWHSDPGFRWSGSGRSGPPSGPRSVFKMKVPRMNLTKRRSCNDHNTPLGTTFMMNAMDVLITNKRKMNSGWRRVPEFTIFRI